MAQVLCFSDRAEFRTMLEFECRAVTGFAPVIHQNLEDLINILEIFPVVDILVLDFSKLTEPLRKFIDSVKTNVKFKHVILVGSEDLSGTSIKFFPHAELEKMVAYLKEKLGFNPEEANDWVGAPLSALYHFKSFPFDLYVKLGPTNFVKRIPAFEIVDEKTIEAFRSKGIEELFFSRAHNKDFSKLLINNMINKVDRTSGGADEDLKARSEVYDTTKEIIRALGLQPKVIEVCDTIVAELTADIISEGGSFAKHIERIKGDTRLNFHYKFIELTCYIGSQILIAIDDKNHSTEVRRFIFAAFFCDITLSEQEHFDHFDPEKVKDKHKFKEVHEHAWKAANMIAKHKEAPLDMAIIIKQHHGAMDGAGFPEKRSPHIHNISKCLIISQELAYGLLTNTHRPAVEVLKNMVKKNQGTPLEQMVRMFEVSVKAS